MLSISEISRWLGITIFELWMWSVGVAVYSILLPIKLGAFSFEKNSGEESISTLRADQIIHQLLPHHRRFGTAAAHHNSSSLSWWHVHWPLFICDALVAYFATIVLIRQYLSGTFLCHRKAVFRAIWSLSQVMLFVLMKLLLCMRLESRKSFSTTEIFAPIFLQLLFLLIRACQLHDQ